MSDSVFDRVRRGAPACLAFLFAGSGTLHMVRPGLFMPLVPRGLPARNALVFGSGIAEIACAAGLLTRSRWAGLGSALLLIAVFPGNVVFAIDSTRAPSTSPVLVAAAWGRLPLQAVFIWAALQARPRLVDKPRGARTPFLPR